jgi:hypothetical protein
LALYARRDLKVVREIPYKANSAVFCLNTPATVHAARPRTGATRPRRHVGLTVEVSPPLFAEGKGRHLFKDKDAWARHCLDGGV